jgi:endonuclease/exonuclease/phosphatase family metal-dependent hydrolase
MRDSARGRQMMRIATWNVGYGVSPSRNSRIVAQMASVDADIWVLTETHDQLSPGNDYCAMSSAPRPVTSRGVRDGSRWATIWTRLGGMAAVTPVDTERCAAATLDTEVGPLLIYATVLPWTNDVARRGMTAELARQQTDWQTLARAHNAGCVVAGDFNVNLGGPHHYGSNASKAAVADALARSGLVAVTDFDHLRYLAPTEGVIDHIAVPAALARRATPYKFWGRNNKDGRPMSDHSGIAVDLDI